MKSIFSTIVTVIILAILSIIPIVSSQEITYIEVNGTTFIQPETINITCWSDNSSSTIYLWNNYTGDIQSISSGIGIQTNITNSSNLNASVYNVYCNSTLNSTLVWKTFSIVSVTTTTTTTVETTSVTTTAITELSTTTETTIPSTTITVSPKIEDKEPPVWSNLRHEPSVVKESDSVNIIVDWSDNLDNVIIYENSTGTWKENVCDKTTGRCSLGIVNLSLTSTGLTSSLLIIALIVIFAIVIFVLIKVVHLPNIISSILAIVIFIFLLSIFISPELSRNISRTFSRLGIIPGGAGKTFSHTIPASDLNIGKVVEYYSSANDTSGNEAKTEIKSFTVQSIEVVTTVPESNIWQVFDFEESRENELMPKNMFIRGMYSKCYPSCNSDQKGWDTSLYRLNNDAYTGKKSLMLTNFNSALDYGMYPITSFISLKSKIISVSFYTKTNIVFESSDNVQITLGFYNNNIDQPLQTLDIVFDHEKVLIPANATGIIASASYLGAEKEWKLIRTNISIDENSLPNISNMTISIIPNSDGISPEPSGYVLIDRIEVSYR